jgi:hypothetical protein
MWGNLQGEAEGGKANQERAAKQVASDDIFEIALYLFHPVIKIKKRKEEEWTLVSRN